jgi:hypothetical protein
MKAAVFCADYDCDLGQIVCSDLVTTQDCFGFFSPQMFCLLRESSFLRKSARNCSILPLFIGLERQMSSPSSMIVD